MALLTDQIFATGVSLNDLIHIVITGDTSQNPAGSSYKASIEQVLQVFTGTTGTSGSSGSSGQSGSSGTSGINGNNGTSGSSGTSGINGNDGTSGSSGTSGINGNDGTSGTSGTSGSAGSSGSSGTGGTSGSSGSAGSSGTSGSSGSAGTSGTSPVSPFPYVYGLFSQIDNSNIVSGTTLETTIIGNGVGTLTVPANGFQIGDSFVFKMYGDIGASNGDQLRIKIKTGSVILGDTGLVSLPNITNSHFNMEVGFTIRATGTSTNAVINSSGFFTYTQNASGSLEAASFSTTNNTTFDTTASNTLDVTAQFDTTAVGTFIYTEFFILNKVY